MHKEKLKIATRLMERIYDSYIPPSAETEADFWAEWFEIASDIVGSLAEERPGSWQSEDAFSTMVFSFRMLIKSMSDAGAMRRLRTRSLN
jgi:hypothetical protein